MSFLWMKRHFCALTAALLLVPTAQAQGVAMVLDRTGEVEVGAASSALTLKLLDYIPADAELRVPAAGSVTLVYLATSQEWTFVGPGRYRLAAGQPTVLDGQPPKARGVPKAGSVALAQLGSTRRDRMALGAVVMRTLGPLRIVGPNSGDVLDTRPLLIWVNTQTDASDAPVRVSVYRAGSSEALVQAVTQESAWRPPVDLTSGAYIWQVELAAIPAGSLVRGRFQVIDSTDARRDRVSTAPPPQAPFSQRLAYALMLEGEGLSHDALPLWRALAAERPDEESLKRWVR